MFRDEVKGVAKNTSIMLFQQLVTWGSTFLLMLFLPRYLGAVEYGWLFLAMSITQIFRVVVEYGGSYLVAKNVARSLGNAGQVLVDAIGFRTVFGVVSIVAIVGFSFLAGYPPTTRLIIFIFSVGLLWQGSIVSLYAAYQGREMMQYTSIGGMTGRVFNSIAVIIAIVLKANVIVISILLVTGGFMQLLALLGFRKKIVTKLPRVDWTGTLRQIKNGLPYFLFAIFSMVYYRIDSVMLSKMSPDEVVGWYGGACRFFESMNFFPSIFSIAIYPVLSRLWIEAEQTHIRTTQKSLEFMLLAGIPATVGLVAFARNLTQLFFGLSEYSASVPVLQILSAGLIVMYVDIVLGTTLLSSDQQRQQSILALCAIPVKLALNYILISYFQKSAENGALGAALSTVLTEVGLMISMLHLVPRQILKSFPVKPVGKALLAGGAMACAVTAGSAFSIPWVAVALTGVVVYVAAIVGLRTLERGEEEFFRSLLSVENLKRAGTLLGLAKSSSTQG